jgi:AAA+ superfamily predicted ATPase
MMSKEPVAWRTYRVVTDDWHYHNFPYKLDLTCQPLYTRKKPLSDDKLLKIALSVAIQLGVHDIDKKDLKKAGVFELARAIEQEHGIGLDNE